MNTIRRSLRAILIASALVLVPVGSFAQSTVESEISLTKGDVVQITGLEDWTAGSFAADAVLTDIWTFNFDTACVHSSTGGYRLEISVANGPGALRLRNGADDELAYELYTSSYSRRRNGSFGRVENEFFTSSPVVLTNRFGSRAVDCDGADNIGFAAIVRQGPFNAAPPGIYRDYATIFVVPE